MAVNALTAATFTVGSPVFGVVLVNYSSLLLLDENGIVLLNQQGAILYSDPPKGMAAQSLAVGSPAIGAPQEAMSVGNVAPSRSGSSIVIPTGAYCLVDAVGAVWTANRSAGGSAWYLDRNGVNAGGGAAATGDWIEYANGSIYAWSGGAWYVWNGTAWVASAAPVIGNFAPAALTVGRPAFMAPLLQLWAHTIPRLDEHGNPVRDEHGAIVYSERASLLIQAPFGVTVGPPSIGVATFGQVLALQRVPLTVGSPSFTAPVLGRVLAATGLAVGSPSLGAATITKTLRGTSVNVASPAFTAPVFTQLQATFLVAGLTTASPTIGVPTFNQVVRCTGVGVTTASPAFTAPALGKLLAAPSLTVASPAFTLPSLTITVSSAALTTASPVFGNIVIVQKQAIGSASLAVASLALGAPSFTQVQKLSPSGLVVGSPAFGGLFLSAFKPISISVGSPSITIPGISQKQVFQAPVGITVGSPILTLPGTAGSHHLSATGFAAGSPVFAAPTAKPLVRLFPLTMETGSPAFTVPVGNMTAVFTPGWLTVGSPVLPVQLMGGTMGLVAGVHAPASPVLGTPLLTRPFANKVPSDNGQWILRGSQFSLVADNGRVATIGADGTVYRDGITTGLIADGMEKFTSQIMLSGTLTDVFMYAWGSFGWAAYVAGVWVTTSAPNLPIQRNGIVTASPIIGRPTSAQAHKVPAIGLVVGRPQIGSASFHPESVPGAYVIWPSSGKVYDLNGTVWSFGAVNPQNASEALVLRNGVNPYATPLYGSVIQVGPPQFTYTSSGVTRTANQAGWVLTAHRQWYFDNGGTAMVAWPAAPNFTMAPTTIAAARPTIGAPTLSRRNAFGITVGRPDIGITTVTTAPSIKTYVFLPAPIGINLGPGNIVVAWPKAGEINRLVAVDLEVWKPDIGDRPLAVALAGNAIGTTDKINPYIDQSAGSALLYSAASGLEKSMADVDGFRLTATYAELVKEQWDPYAISSQNLPFLAYAQGVNLWEADWTDASRRWWVANQWELKQQRGSLLGTSRFVSAVGQKVMHAIVPPAKFHPGKSLTAEERAAYNARFAQLRLYPFVARVQLPWLCYVSNFRVGFEQKRRYTFNGCFLGPLRKMYPTSADAGGRYTRTATIWDRGVETPITVRTVKDVSTPGVVTTWDEVVVPAKIANHYYAGQEGKWPLKPGHPVRQNKYGIFLGIMDETAKRIIKIPRNGELDVTTAKAIYQTIVPDNTYIDVYPQHVATPHPRSARRLYCGAPRGRRKEYLINKYLPASIAFQFLYEVWYIFDYARVPDYRRASVYMGQARFGMHKYTAEIRIQIPIKWRKWYIYNGGFLSGHLHPPDTRELDKCRRAVTASMAVRDTVRIDTIIKRRINTNDSLPCDGSFTVGQYVDA
jgi:phage tail P2-like protein